MSRLVPEKRLDRNGRMVTRHVRQDAGTARGARALPPARAVAAPRPVPAAGLADTPGLRRAQREQKPMRVAFTVRSRELMDALPGWESNGLAFEASEVEIYDVAAVCREDGDAAHLVAAGIRTGDAARGFLHSKGLDHLVADRSELMREALSKNLGFESFISHIDSGRWPCPAVNRIGAARLRASSLSGIGGITRATQEILAGRLDFEDIKAVGIGLLKRQDKILSFVPLLEGARDGAEGYSIESIRALAERIEAENLASATQVALLADRAGVDAVLELPSLAAAANVVRALTASHELGQPDGAARALYMSRLLASGVWDTAAAREFYDAGVPVETAIAVRANGGGVAQAVAIEQEGVPAAVAGGYL